MSPREQDQNVNGGPLPYSPEDQPMRKFAEGVPIAFMVGIFVTAGAILIIDVITHAA
ncbi:MAG TPA: hypothetical protein VMR76_00695 [Candidatus Saccharimonadia bacterium]|nr:hypothetical protein [Candidatus Saccharimonadia bacterium]